MALGLARKAIKDPYCSTRNLTDNSHGLGVVGEKHLGKLLGIEIADDVSKEGDGGEDFPGINVKTTTVFDAPWLTVVDDDINPLISYALIAVDVATHRSQYCGYATGKMLRQTSLSRHRRDGPLNRVLDITELVRLLPKIKELTNARSSE